MHTHQLQSNRFELKYIISEGGAKAARDFLRGYLIHDEYAKPELGNAYHIHSLYLDSPDRELCQATMDGLKNRFKLRIRFYDDVPENPVYFEIKRRVNDVIKKERTAVRRDRVPSLLNYRWPNADDLVKYTPKSLATLEQFCRLRDILHADACVFVSYLREAHVSENDDQIRVTFDRQIEAGMYGRSLGIKPIDSRYQPRINGVVLELKFLDRFPHWMRDMVRSLNFQRIPMAKYVYCVESLNNFAPRISVGGSTKAPAPAADKANNHRPAAAKHVASSINSMTETLVMASLDDTVVGMDAAALKNAQAQIPADEDKCEVAR